MPNACGNFLENLRMKTGISCDEVSTIRMHIRIHQLPMWTITLIIPHLFTIRLTPLSTSLFSNFTSVGFELLPTIHSAYNYHSFLKKGE